VKEPHNIKNGRLRKRTYNHRNEKVKLKLKGPYNIKNEEG
jgi:hypothetical protein